MQEDHVRRCNAARHVATAFANTAALLYERDLKQMPPKRPRHVVPFVVNASFAVELFLKALSHRHGVSLRGHQRLKLYDRLPEDASLDIQSASARVAAQTVPPQFQNTRQALSELNNAFVEWRYVHEKQELGPLNLGSVVLLVKVMHEACATSAV